MRNLSAPLEQWIQHVHQSFVAAVDDALAAYVALGADVGDLQVRRRTAPHLSVYRCPLDASLYHVGHMPKGASRAGARASSLRRAGKATPPAHGGGAASGVD